MAQLKAEITSVSSQDYRHKAENVLNPTNLKKWTCKKDDIGKDLILELNLAISSKIEHINIGNHGSAFVEVTVGRSSWQPGKPYEVFLPSISLMSPSDSKNWSNISKVVLLGKASFRGHIAEQKWDRVRIRCRQPFSQDRQFGLDFFELRGAEKSVDNGNATPLNKKTGTETGANKFKNIVEKALNSSGKLTTPNGLMTRTERCLGNALSKSKAGNRPIRKAWSDSALKREKSGVSKKFHLEVDCFLREAKLEEMDFAQVKVASLRERMEKVRGATLNKAEKRVFFEIVGKKVNAMSCGEDLALKFQATGYKSFEAVSEPKIYMMYKPRKELTQLATPLAGLNDEDRARLANRRMQRRGMNVVRSKLFYDNDSEEPPTKLSKEESLVTVEDKERNTEKDDVVSVEKEKCSLCGKTMSHVLLEIHAKFCEGKTEFEDESQETQGGCEGVQVQNVTEDAVTSKQHDVIVSSSCSSKKDSVSPSVTSSQNLNIKTNGIGFNSCNTSNSSKGGSSFTAGSRIVPSSCRSDILSLARQFSLNDSVRTEATNLNSDCIVTYERSGLVNSRPFSISEPYMSESQCPVCLRQFPTYCIEYHANQCLDFGCQNL